MPVYDPGHERDCTCPILNICGHITETVNTPGKVRGGGGWKRWEGRYRTTCFCIVLVPPPPGHHEDVKEEICVRVGVWKDYL